MATEAEAHEARAQHSDYLKDSGAHALAVDRIQRGGVDTFGVIAFYENEPPGALPDSLEIVQEGKMKRVPLATIITPRATLE